MTRTDTVRHAATTTKDSVRHAAEAVAPYAGSARDAAGRYARDARKVLVPRVAAAADQAREVAVARYDEHLAPRLAQVGSAVPPAVAASTAAAAERTRRTAKRAARRAARYAGPRIEQAVEQARTATEPVREEAAARAGAALAALRGQISPADVKKAIRRERRRAWTGRATKGFMVIGVVAGAGVAAWRWWTRQANPDWLVEAPSATEPAEDERLSPGGVASPTRTTVEESVEMSEALDPEAQARAEEEARRRRGDSHG